MKFEKIIQKYRMFTNNGQYYSFGKESPLVMYEVVNKQLIQVRNKITLQINGEFEESCFRTYIKDSKELDIQLGKLYREWEEVLYKLKQLRMDYQIKQMEKDFE